MSLNPTKYLNTLDDVDVLLHKLKYVFVSRGGVVVLYLQCTISVTILVL